VTTGTSARASDPVHRGDADRWGGWEWRDPTRGEHFRRCSYCGCVHPDDLTAEPGVRIDWADMKYGWPHKFYAHIPNREPGRLFVVSTVNHPPRDGEWITVADADPAVEEVLDREGYAKGSKYRPLFVQFGTREHHVGKFYTVHLADPEISAATKTVIEQLMGLRLTFAGGRVMWERADSVGAR
jgi:hypothetical protein